MGLLDGGSDYFSQMYGSMLTPDQLAAAQQQRGMQGLLAMGAAIGAASGPSRLPVPLGSALGAGAGALVNSNNGFDQNFGRTVTLPYQVQGMGQENALRQFDIDYFNRQRAAAGLPPIGPARAAPAAGILGASPSSQIGSGLLAGSDPSSSAANPAQKKVGTVAPSNGNDAVPPSSTYGSGSSIPGSAASASAPAPSAGAMPGFTLPGIAAQIRSAASSPAGMKTVPTLMEMMKNMLPPGTQPQADGSIAPIPGLYDVKAGEALAAKGFVQGSNGVWYLPAGAADATRQMSAADAEGKAPSQLYVARNTPREMRGPGSVIYDPMTKTYVQVANEVDNVDPNSGAHFKSFVPLGLESGTVGGGAPQPTTQPPPASGFRGGGLLGVNVANGPGVAPPPGSGPLASMASRLGPPTFGGGGALPPPSSSAPPLSAPAPGPVTPSPGVSAPGVGGGYQTFQTQLAPARLQAEEGLGRDFAEKDKKAFDSANTGLMSLYQMNAAADRMAQTGGWATPGSAAELRFGAAKFINTVEQMAGRQPTFDPNTVASWENLSKETRRAGMELVNSEFGGQREAASIVQGATNSVPHDENSYLGFRLVSSSIQQAMTRQQDLYNFKADRLSKGGSLLTAERDFNKANPPQNYVRRAIANAVPDAAVQLLTQNPAQYRAQFDAKYGTGMSDYVLAGQRTGMIGIR